MAIGKNAARLYILTTMVGGLLLPACTTPPQNTRPAPTEVPTPTPIPTPTLQPEVLTQNMDIRRLYKYIVDSERNNNLSLFGLETRIVAILNGSSINGVPLPSAQEIYNYYSQMVAFFDQRQSIQVGDRVFLVGSEPTVGILLTDRLAGIPEIDAINTESTLAGLDANGAYFTLTTIRTDHLARNGVFDEHDPTGLHSGNFRGTLFMGACFPRLWNVVGDAASQAPYVDSACNIIAKNWVLASFGLTDSEIAEELARYGTTGLKGNTTTAPDLSYTLVPEVTDFARQIDHLPPTQLPPTQ